MPLINRCGGGGGTPQLCGQVDNFVVHAGNLSAILSWTAPSPDEDSSFIGTRIVRKTGSAPTSIHDGTVVYEGTALTYTDTGLTAGTTYYYRAFAYNAKQKYQTAMRSVSITAIVCLRAADLPVGSIVSFKVNNNPMDFIVVHQGNPDASIYDETANGTWIIAKLGWYALGANNVTWNEYNSERGDYGTSFLHYYLTGYRGYDFTTNLLETQILQNLYESKALENIREVNVPYKKVTAGKLESKVSKVSAKVFAPTLKELGITNNYSAGAKLDYFTAGTTSAAKQKRVAYRYEYEDVTISYHSRDAAGKTTSYCIDDTGAADNANNVNNSHAVRVINVLDFNALFNATPNASGAYTFYE